MANKHRSIGERLQRAKSPEARAELLRDWVANWRNDQMDVLDLLNAAIESGDTDLLTSSAGQLRAIIDKRFPALVRVLDTLLSEDTTTAADR